jgi:hypothetical protein
MHPAKAARIVPQDRHRLHRPLFLGQALEALASLARIPVDRRQGLHEGLGLAGDLAVYLPADMGSPNESAFCVR